MSKIYFTKMHGCGNDYIYVDATRYPITDPSAAAIAWSDRHKGIGSDGLVLIDRSSVAEADYSMRIFNADGSEAMMCGNASRCIGKYLFERIIAPTASQHEAERGHQEAHIRLLTLSGIKTLYLHIENNIVESVSVDMGKPVFDDERLFNPSHAKSLSAFLPGKEPGKEPALFVSMGNPHYVIFTEDVDRIEELGPTLEHHPAFPQRCGTGACATAVAAALTGRADRTSHIVMDGGTLTIEWRETDQHVYMTGPAEFAFYGTIEL